MAERHYLVLTGGIGGAKLALGLSHLLEPEEVTFVVNTGDDFEHLGLSICPDMDTLMYTLADACNPETGWGRKDESWQFMLALKELGGELWFQLGDKDLAVHLLRTHALRQGDSLSEITRRLCQQLGVDHRVLPMSDHPVRTIVETETGELMFQHYFVRDRCQPAVSGFHFEGSDQAQINPHVQHLLSGQSERTLQGVILCPSNPYVSIDPMLSLPGFRELLVQVPCPVVAVSPVVGGGAIKGPTVKMMRELSIPGSTVEVARHYEDFLNGFVLDQQDASLQKACEALGFSAISTHTVMVTLEDRIHLAADVLAFIERLKSHEKL